MREMTEEKNVLFNFKVRSSTSMAGLEFAMPRSYSMGQLSARVTVNPYFVYWDKDPITPSTPNIALASHYSFVVMHQIEEYKWVNLSINDIHTRATTLLTGGNVHLLLGGKSNWDI